MPARHFYKRILLLTFILSILFYFLTPHHVISYFYYYFNPTKSIKCYRYKHATLPDITDLQPTTGRSIFFHETSCNSHFNGKISITARQACAVESAAKLNPNHEIFLLFASPGVFRFNNSHSDRFLRALMSYDNVKLRHVNYERYSKDTPVEALYRSGYIESSSYAQSHASDVLRYLTLWKYGGIYLDLDVIVIKSLEDLPENYAGSESPTNVAAGVINLGSSDLGHMLAEMCLNDLKSNFKGYDWGNNGPGVITRLLRRICGVEEAKDMIDRDCEGFTVYPPEAFYPIRWQDWAMYFDESSLEEVMNLSEKSYVVHVWNKHSVDTKLPITSRAPYANFARNFCPKVFSECKEYF